MSDEQGAIPEARVREATPFAVDAKVEYPAFCSWWTRTIPAITVPSSASHQFDAWMASARHRTPDADSLTDTGEGLPTDRYGETALDRIRDYAVNGTMPSHFRRDLFSVLDLAIPKPPVDAGAMRERCAQMADDLASIAARSKLHPHPLVIDTNEAWRRVEDACKDIAAAIRNLSDDGETM